MPTMPPDNPEEECVVVYGANSWTGTFFAKLPKNKTEKDLSVIRDTCERRLPNSIQFLLFFKIYRLETHERMEPKIYEYNTRTGSSSNTEVPTTTESG